MEPKIPLRCDNRLRLSIEAKLKGFAYESHSYAQLRQAAVAITVVSVNKGSRRKNISSCRIEDEDAALILTQRSPRLKHHAGQ